MNNMQFIWYLLRHIVRIYVLIGSKRVTNASSVTGSWIVVYPFLWRGSCLPIYLTNHAAVRVGQGKGHQPKDSRGSLFCGVRLPPVVLNLSLYGSHCIKLSAARHSQKSTCQACLTQPSNLPRTQISIKYTLVCCAIPGVLLRVAGSLQ